MRTLTIRVLMTLTTLTALSLGTTSCASTEADEPAATAAATEPPEPPYAPYDSYLDRADSRCTTEISKANTQRYWDTEFVSVADEGQTLIFDAVGTDFGKSWKAAACVLAHLDVPAAISNQMDSTTSLMGMQTATDGPFTYQWSYHPDNGFNAIITETPWEEGDEPATIESGDSDA